MANPEHVEIVLQGAAAIAAWRKAHPGGLFDLEGAIFFGASFERANLEEAILAGIILIEAILAGIILIEANLEEAILAGAILAGANLERAILERASLVEVILVEANLAGANLEEANLRGANLAGVNLEGANLEGANLRGASLDDDTQIADKWELVWLIVNGGVRGINLTEVDLTGANLTGADLSGLDLSRANLQGANLSEVTLSGTILRDIGIDQATLENTRPILPELLQAFLARISPEDELRYIRRTIEFAPEYRQAGISIMNYFAEVMRQKYPDIPATVQITQEELTVRMTIKTEDGHREIVEQTLEEYGMVISGQRQPAEMFDDAIAIMRLENKFDVVKTELQAERRANRLLEMYGSEQKVRIEHLETEVSALREIVGNSLAGAQAATHQAQQISHLLAAGAVNHSQILAALFARHLDRAPENDTLRQALSTIQALAERAVTSTAQDTLSIGDKAALTQASADIETAGGTDWAAFKGELVDFLRGVGAGVGGNYTTGMVRDLIRFLSVL